jgi:hypothetical protein
MAQQEYPTLFGVDPSWADVSIKFGIYGGSQVQTSDIAAISCSDSLEIGVKRGTGGKKTGRGTGQADNECSLTMYRVGLRTLLRELKAKAPLRNGARAVGLVGFDILTQHSPPSLDDDSPDIYTIKIAGCRLAGRNYTMAEGADLDQVEVPINCMDILEKIDDEWVTLL